MMQDSHERLMAIKVPMQRRLFFTEPHRQFATDPLLLKGISPDELQGRMLCRHN